MTYKEILAEMLGDLKKDVEKYLTGSRENYIYRKEHTEEYGDTDKNYDNRKRLCYGLLLNVCEIPEQKREEMTRELFEQEIISRENESFQGIGENLEILTLLMRQYRRDEDRELFKRAKNANFDCFLGYDPEHDYSRPHEKPELYSVYSSDPETYDLRDCIKLAYSMDMQKHLCRLLDILKESDMSRYDYKNMLRYYKLTGREEDRETAVKGYFRLTLSSPETDDMARLKAYEEIIDLLAEKGEGDEAFELLNEGTKALRKFNMRSFYDCTLKIMETSPEIAKEVWKYAGYYADMDIARKDLCPVCYDVVGKCAELAGDNEIMKTVNALKASEK